MVSDATCIKCVAIAALGAMEAAALLTGVDGAMFGAVVAAISGITGYQLGKTTSKKAKKEAEK